MKILFIGTGAADWVLKERKGDEFFRRLTAVKINDDLMIDCSPDTSDFTAKNPDALANVKDVLITHTHSDHYSPQTIGEILRKDVRVWAEKVSEEKILSDMPQLESSVLGIFEENTVGRYIVIPVVASHSVADRNQTPVNYIISDGEKTSVQQGGVGVCVEQVISDGEDAYIYLSVELPGHLEVEKWKTGEDRLYFRQNEIRINDNAPERVNFTLKHLEENQAYGIVYISLEKVGEGDCKVSLTLNNLDYAVFVGEEKGWDIQRLVEETWELNWSFSCEKIAKSYMVEATIDAHDGTVMTTEAVVSPLSVRVTGIIECDDPTYSQVSCYIDSVILKDGTLEEYDANYSQMEEETKKYNMKWYFKRMIPIEDVIGVVVNGEYIYFN